MGSSNNCDAPVPKRERMTYEGSGFSVAGIGATLFGCALAWIGLVVPALRPLYDYAWFVGFGVAAAVHLALAPSTPAVAVTAAPVGESVLPSGVLSA